MQSDLLQQAIVDATALKEAAIKNAENTLIEKYSHEFEQTVQRLLEQEAAPAAAAPQLPPMPATDAAAPDAAPPDAPAPDMSATGDVTGMAGEQESEGEKAFSKVPSSFLDGNENDKIVINFNQIKKTMMEMFDLDGALLETDTFSGKGEAQLRDALDPGAPQAANKNAVVEEDLDEELELDESWDQLEFEGLELEQEYEGVEQLSGQQTPKEKPLQEVQPQDILAMKQKAADAQTRAAGMLGTAQKAKADADKLASQADSAEANIQNTPEVKPVEEDIEITEEELAELAESFKVDMNIEAQGRGWIGATTAQKREQRAVELAAARDDKAVEEREEEMEKMGDLVKENKTLYSKVKKYEASNEELVSTLQVLKEQLEKVNLSNAKLLYTNKALGNISLNERQKSQIVESISKADSVLAAKTIYETLQNAVESTKVEKEAPQTLREALNRAQSPFVTKKSSTNSINDVMAERMKALAGIKQAK